MNHASSSIPSPSSTRVVGYIRGSTVEQQNTLQVQRQQLEGYCAFRGLTLVECFVDEGESAFSTSFYERPAAARMITEMPSLHAEGIVISKLDRGFRDALDCLFTVQDLKNKGLAIHILDIQLDTTTPIGMLMLTMLAAIAEFENKRRAERQTAAFQVMRSSGQRCGTVPYGWQTIPSMRISKTKRQGEDLIPHPEEQAFLWWIKVGWANESCNEVARRLNAQGVPAKKGGRWYGASVESVREHGQLAESTPAQAAA